MGFLARPIGELLGFIHTLLGGVLTPSSGPAWALSIVLLTVVVRLVLLPLFVVQTRSSRRMQLLSPRVRAIQKEHGSDPERFSHEIMALYKRAGVSPWSTFLPLLLQIPVFFGLFSVVRAFGPDASAAHGLSAETLTEGASASVFGAPFASRFLSSGSELAALDALPLTVRLVCAALIVATAVSAAVTQHHALARARTTDPTQLRLQRAMRGLVPAFLLGSGVIFPVGVLLYFVSTNLFSYLQQVVLLDRLNDSVRLPDNLDPSPEEAAQIQERAAQSSAARAARRAQSKVSDPESSSPTAEPTDLDQERP